MPVKHVAHARKQGDQSTTGFDIVGVVVSPPTGGDDTKFYRSVLFSFRRSSCVAGRGLDCPALRAFIAASHRQARMPAHHIESIASHGAGGEVRLACENRRPHTMIIIYGKMWGRSRLVAHAPTSAHLLPRSLAPCISAPAHPPCIPHVLPLLSLLH